MLGFTPLLYRNVIMSRVCQLTGTRANNGMAVSHSHIRTKKLQQANLQQRRLCGQRATAG